MIVTKPLTLGRLQTELSAAGIQVRGLGRGGDTLYAYDAQGGLIDLPSSAQPVVDAHVADPPPPIPDFGGDDTAQNQLANAVSTLRQYLTLSAPTSAQNVTVLKLLIHVVLAIVRQVFQ